MNNPLPPDYSWLATVKTPEILVQAVRLYGVREKPGPDNSPVIMAWAKELGGVAGNWYTSDDKAWCGLFIAICSQRAGFKAPDGFSALRARDWAKWGNPISGQPGRGDVLVFERTGGGHVGLYVAEDKTCYHVLGGNQSDMVNVSRIEKSRLLTARRSPGITKAVQTFVNAAGKISKNEA